MEAGLMAFHHEPDPYLRQLDEEIRHAPHPDLYPKRCVCEPDPRGPLFTKHAADCPRRPLAAFEREFG
jgi:hypothetical protein